ncbi:MAG: LuxR C-terminal-related transcriptional regulator [Rubrivivax sp.]
MSPPMPALQAHLAELSALRPLRDSDPAELLRRVAELPSGWPPELPAHDRRLLEATRQLLIGGATFWLGDPAAFAAARDAAWRALEQAQGAEPALVDDCRMQLLHMAAYHAERQGDYEAAFKGYVAALGEARAAGNRRYPVTILGNMAAAFEEAGLYAESIAHHREALALARELGLAREEGDILHNLGNALGDAGDREAALASFALALESFEALGLPERVGSALIGMAEQRLELGQSLEALALVQRARALPRQLPLAPAYAAGLQARILTSLGRLDDAQQAWQEALDLYAGRGEPPGQARARTGLARVAHARGRLAEAAEHIAAAVAWLAPTSAWRERLEAHDEASRIHEALGQPVQALAHARAHHAAYERLFNDRASRRATLLSVQHEVERARADAQRHALESARLAEALAEVASRLQPAAAHAAPARPGGPASLRGLGLTPREAEVLYWVCEGKTNEDVADIVGTGLAAVKKNLLRIYEKLGVENRTSAAAEVRRRGLA